MNIAVQITGNPLFQAACSVVGTLQRQGHKAYFVGGVVRDLLLGKKPKDIDIATSALPVEVQKLFPGSHDIGASFGIITVVVDKMPFEVATFREEREYSDGRHPEQVFYTDDPELDAVRRDFTINSLFYDPLAEELLDFTGGVDDLKAGVLRTVGNARQRFAEDYLRILRAVRFANRLRFEICPDIFEAIRALKDNLKKLSIERIREELSLMLLGAHPSGAFRLMLDLGVLEVILPEVAVLRGVEQPKLFHPEGDVFEHTMLMLEHMSYPSVELGWSILLHDIGKPATFFIGDDGRERFYCHEEQGAEIAEEILLRFKFPTRSIAKIVSAVRNHMRFAHVDKMRKAKWKRLMAEPGFFMELELHRIDCIASNGKLENYVLLLDRLAEAEHVVEVPEKLVSGRDLIDAGMKPGPEFKIILDKIVDLQLEGEIQTREQALEFIHRQA